LGHDRVEELSVSQSVPLSYNAWQVAAVQPFENARLDIHRQRIGAREHASINAQLRPTRISDPTEWPSVLLGRNVG